MVDINVCSKSMQAEYNYKFCSLLVVYKLSQFCPCYFKLVESFLIGTEC